MRGWSSWLKNASLLSFWRHCKHCLPDGIIGTGPSNSHFCRYQRTFGPVGWLCHRRAWNDTDSSKQLKVAQFLYAILITTIIFLFQGKGEMMTYWLVGEEPWRTRRGHVSTIEPEIPTITQSTVVDPVTHEIPLMIEKVQSSSELDPIDTNPSTWLLSDCPVIPEGDQPPEYELNIPQLNNVVDMSFDDRNNCTVGHYQSPKSLIRQQSTRESSCRTCTQNQENSSKRHQRMMSPRYRSAPIITANQTYHRDSSPTVPIRTTSPQSCV